MPQGLCLSRAAPPGRDFIAKQGYFLNKKTGKINHYQ